MAIGLDIGGSQSLSSNVLVGEQSLNARHSRESGNPVVFYFVFCMF